MAAAWGQVHDAARSFWGWWSGELAGLVPARIAALAYPLPRLLLRVQDEDFGRVGLSGGRLVEHGPFTAEPQAGSVEPVPAVLLVPAEWALQKILGLPAEAEPHLARLLAFEIERQTPFTAAQVYFTWSVVGRDALNRRLDLRLAVVPKARLDAAIARAEVRGAKITVAAVDGGDPSTIARRNMLARAATTPADRRPDRWLLLAALLLGMAALAGPDLRYGRERAHLANEIAQTREAAGRQAGERAVQAEAVQQWTTLAELTRGAPSATLILEALSRLLPDDTWLNQVTLTGRELTLEGVSASAARLVPLLEASPLFTKVAFVGATTLDAKTGQERFQFTIRLREPPP